MKNHILNKSMLSFATAVVLFTTGCGPSDSSTTKDSTTPTSEAQTVLGGVVNLNTSTAASAPARKSMARADAAVTLECGDSAKVQLYAIEDTNYATPLLTSPVEVNQTDCSFDVTDENFVDATNAGSDKQYIVRTIIKTGTTFMELSAAKLSEGTDVGTVDPIATMIKERFEAVLEDVKSGMAKLSDLGVTQDAINAAVNNIIVDFEKNFDTTVANLKADIDAGKVTVDTTLFETKETLDTQVTDEVLKVREAKADEIAKTLQDSSVNAAFDMLDNSVKQQQLDSAVITEDTLRNGLTPALADLKYGVIESFVKIGLPVHDGLGNIIVSMPIEEQRKGELPGKTFSIAYMDENNVTQTIGSDYTIRLINPSSDLSNVSGQEDWYKQYLADLTTIIPSNAIDSIMVNKDHLTTMQELGTVLSFGDSVDVFEATGIYDVNLSNNIDESVGKIVGLFEDKLIQNSYDMMLWEAVDGILGEADLSTPTTREKAITTLKELPFVVQGEETATQFLARFKAIPEVSDYLVGTIGESLSSGIPLSADKGMLQFQDGVQITPNSTMKPLASLAMINLYMNAGNNGMSEETVTYRPESLDNMFGWMNDGDTTAFEGKMLWVPDYSFEDATEPSNINAAPSRKAISPEVQAETNIVISLVAATTGDNTLIAERTFYDTVEALSNARSVIEQKSMNSNDFGFEDEFKGSMVDYGNTATTPATLSLTIQDFNNDSVDVSELNATLLVAPIFANVTTGEWKTVIDKNTTLSFNGSRYVSSTEFSTYNPDPAFSFDENGSAVTTGGEYQATGEFDLILVKEDGVKIPLATFPIFPDTNDLDMPFYYDDSMMGGFEGMSFDDVSTEDLGISTGTFAEHRYITTDSNIFFPQITTTDGEDVGENLFTYSVTDKTFTPSLTNGVVSTATMNIVKLFDSYEDNTEGEDTVTNITLDETVTEGAFFRLELSGPYIQTQNIMMSIVYVGDDGEVEYELFKEDRFEDEMMSTMEGFTPEMLQGTYYLATRNLADGSEYLSTITFDQETSTATIEENNTTSEAVFEITPEGYLFLFNDDTSFTRTMKIANEKEDGALLVIEGYDAYGVDTEQSFDRLVFATDADREAFLASDAEEDDSTSDDDGTATEDDSTSDDDGDTTEDDSTSDDDGDTTEDDDTSDDDATEDDDNEDNNED